MTILKLQINGKEDIQRLKNLKRNASNEPVRISSFNICFKTNDDDICVTLQQIDYLRIKTKNINEYPFSSNMIKLSSLNILLRGHLTDYYMILTCPISYLSSISWTSSLSIMPSMLPIPIDRSDCLIPHLLKEEMMLSNNLGYSFQFLSLQPLEWQKLINLMLYGVLDKDP